MNTHNMECREKIGSLFVKITQSLFGGEISRNGENDPILGNIDIINWEKNQAYESKGSISSDHHKITPKQVDHNRNLRDCEEFPLDHPEIYYCFWQHKSRGVSRKKNKDLERFVVGKINRLLVVSFDIIERGSYIWDYTGIDSWGQTMMFRSSERTELTKNTIAYLRKMELNPYNYDIKREEIPKGIYRYYHQFSGNRGWSLVPEFELTTVTHKKLKGLERLK